MKKTMIRVVCLGVLISFNVSYLKAQETYSSSGGTVKNENGTFSYSLGCAFSTASSNQKVNVEQGVLHPQLNSERKGSELSAVEVMVFPNPTTDFLKVSFKDVEMKVDGLDYRIYNSQGTDVLIGNFDENAIIQVGFLAKANYYLEILDVKEKRTIIQFIKN